MNLFLNQIETEFKNNEHLRKTLSYHLTKRHTQSHTRFSLLFGATREKTIFLSQWGHFSEKTLGLEKFDEYDRPNAPQSQKIHDSTYPLFQHSGHILIEFVELKTTT